MTCRLALAGAAAALAAALMVRLGQGLSWGGVVVLGGAGATAGWAVGRLQWGILRGMLLYGLGLGLMQVLSSQMLIVTHPCSAGSAILFLTALVWHVVVGAALGFVNDCFDNDHLWI